MNSLLYFPILRILGVIGTLVVNLRNSCFQSGAKAQEMEKKLREFEKQALAADETLVLSDYSPSKKTFVVLSDSKIHGWRQQKKTSVHFDITYAEVKRCRLSDIMGNKVAPNGNVMNIYLQTCADEVYKLYAFPKATQIAYVLDAHELL